MTDKEAMDLRKQLEEHYGEPVRPASEHCNALWSWLDVANDYLKSYQIDASTVRMVIVKSAALHRFLYMDEKPRTVPCPKHQGQWSGCHMSDQKPCECTSRDGNITGWLPNDPSEVYNPVWVKISDTMSVQQHTEAGVYIPKATEVLAHGEVKGGLGTEE